MPERKNLCAMIPLELHEQVSRAREAAGQTTSEYITQLLIEYYKMKKDGGTTTMATRTMAFQIPEELFQRIKAHLERETARTGQKLTQRDFVLPDLLAHLGYSVRRIGSYYTTREMDSIRIKNRRSWRRYSNGRGGDAITFLQEFCGKSFQEAVEYLLDFHGRTRDSPAAQRPRPPPVKEEQPVFALPPAHTDKRRVFAYLLKRGIAPRVIRDFISAGLLYEEARFQRRNPQKRQAHRIPASLLLRRGLGDGGRGSH